jgi:hypothetical protein
MSPANAFQTIRGVSFMAQPEPPAAPGDPASTTAVSIPLIEAEGLQPIYANFVKVNSTYEELIFDYGLNPNVPGTAPVPIKISQRLVMNFYTAKRLLAALAHPLQRHEQGFGVVEIDVAKRVIPPGQRSVP